MNPLAQAEHSWFFVLGKEMQDHGNASSGPRMFMRFHFSEELKARISLHEAVLVCSPEPSDETTKVSAHAYPSNLQVQIRLFADNFIGRSSADWGTSADAFE